MGPRTVLVVCNGNIHRSVIAQLCIDKALKQRGLQNQIQCISRGLQGTCGTSLPSGKNLRDYPDEWGLTKPALDRLGLIIPEGQRSTPVDEAIVRKASVILAMDREVLSGRFNSLLNQFRDHSGKMKLFSDLVGQSDDVPDCFGSKDPAQHERVNSLILWIVDGGTDHLVSLVGSQ